MGRVLSTAFCVALLAVAAAAFALTEGAKTELSPIYGTKIDKVFSPTCNLHVCAKRVADVEFELRHPERIDVWIESSSGATVATLAAGVSYPRGRVLLHFSGRTASGAVLPDGDYLPVVRLVGDHRTFRLPNPIQLDTKPPRVVNHTRILHVLLAPGDPGERQQVAVHYLLDEHSHGILFADGHRVEFTYRQPLRGVLTWNGRIDNKDVAPGTYSLELAAQDEAGNRSHPVVVGEVAVRYLELAVKKVRVRPKARFSVRVILGPARLSWVFAGRRGTTGARTLRLRAPKKRGRYRLYVSGSGHHASALVVVA